MKDYLVNCVFFYETPDDGCLPFSRPFKYTHFFQPKRVTAWKFFGLNQTDEEKKFVSNECFACKSGLCEVYKDLYDHDWNPNGSVTRFKVNARKYLMMSLILLLRFRLEHLLLLLDST